MNMLRRLYVIIGFLWVCVVFTHFTLIRPVVAATQEIVAVVNENAISDSDLRKRLRLIMASSGLPDTKEIRQKLTQQVLSGLINEQLMLQEAKKFGIEISRSEIEAGFASVAQQNNFKPDQFLSMLKKGGIDPSTMYQQVEAQVAWSKFVKARLRPRVTISERDIDDTLERIRSKIGTTEYLAAEIFLPVETLKDDAQIKRLADELVREIKSGKASFFKLAQQFSQAAGSMSGGDKGWVNEAQFSENLLQELKSVKKNQISKPVKTLDGYHILFLRDKRTLSDDTVPSREQVEHNIGSDRLDKIQRRHLMDLRLASFVDIRV